MSLIALTTDFGVGSSYVAQMKGVLLASNPTCQLVDVSHGVQPQNLLEAALLLRGVAFAFPLGTVHLVVVDPGVGTQRRAIAIEVNGTFFVGPDNGVLGGIAQLPGAKTVHLDKSFFFREPVSNTFHGRDVFAPIAAELSAGIRLSEVGTPIEDPKPGILTEPTQVKANLIGEILGPDSFGNLLTNLPGYKIDQSSPLVTHGLSLSWVETYQQAPIGELVGLIGSDGFVEVALRDGSALSWLGDKALGAIIEGRAVGSVQ